MGRKINESIKDHKRVFGEWKICYSTLLASMDGSSRISSRMSDYATDSMWWMESRRCGLVIKSTHLDQIKESNLSLLSTWSGRNSGTLPMWMWFLQDRTRWYGFMGESRVETEECARRNCWFTPESDYLWNCSRNDIWYEDSEWRRKNGTIYSSRKDETIYSSKLQSST